MMSVVAVLTFFVFALLGVFVGSALVVLRVRWLNAENERLTNRVRMEQKRRESLEAVVWSTMGRNFKSELLTQSKWGRK